MSSGIRNLSPGEIFPASTNGRPVTVVTVEKAGEPPAKFEWPGGFNSNARLEFARAHGLLSLRHPLVVKKHTTVFDGHSAIVGYEVTVSPRK